MAFRIWISILMFQDIYVEVIRDKVSCHAKCNLFSNDSEKIKEKNEKERKMKQVWQSVKK